MIDTIWIASSIDSVMVTVFSHGNSKSDQFLRVICERLDFDTRGRCKILFLQRSNAFIIEKTQI